MTNFARHNIANQTEFKSEMLIDSLQCRGQRRGDRHLPDASKWKSRSSLSANHRQNRSTAAEDGVITSGA